MASLSPNKALLLLCFPRTGHSRCSSFPLYASDAHLLFSPSQEKMIAGATARGISQTVLHPIDVARTRLQAKGVKKDWSPKVFLKGVTPQIILAVPAGALQFLGFEFCKEQLPNILPGAGLADVRSLLAGAGGALAASVVRVPQEVLKQRIQADMYPNLVTALPSILKKDGVAGLYK